MRRYTLGLGGREFVIDVQELAADRFTVVVGDESYEVTLSGDEDLPEATITPGYPPTAAAGPAAGAPAAGARVGASTPAHPMPARPKAGAGAGAGGATLSAPMPGVILEIHVQRGDRVVRGQPIAVLDAMKMHNVIGAPRAGTIGEVCVAPGQAVGHGDAIVRFAQD